MSCSECSQVRAERDEAILARDDSHTYKLRLMAVKKDRDSLTEKLAVAVEALSVLGQEAAFYNMGDLVDVAREALQAIGGKDK